MNILVCCGVCKLLLACGQLPALQCPPCRCHQAHVQWTSRLVGRGQQHRDHLSQVGMELKHGGEWKKRKEKRKAKTTPFGVSFMRGSIIPGCPGCRSGICSDFDDLQSMARACSQQTSMAFIAVHMVGTVLDDQGIDVHVILASLIARNLGGIAVHCIE